MESPPATATVLRTFFLLLLASLFLNCFTDFRSHAQLLPEDEVKALQAISEKLQIKDINFTQSFCSTNVSQNALDDDIARDIACSCSDTVCHITRFVLTGQNLTGTLPAEFANLTYLRVIDLSRNYIWGPIPTAFGQIPLIVLSLSGSRINGSIPEEIADIVTLQLLDLEDTLLGGPLPQKLGNMRDLRWMLISGNNFTGTIPGTFINLKNLMGFRIDGSMLSGKIPDLIGNWTYIDRLDLQGTGMNGPIPSTISQLESITELRISDLAGSNIKFPDLSRLTNLEYLILRNCGIVGSIPHYISGFTELELLDLSFNMLTGNIPTLFASLSSRLDFLFLNNNSLTGAIPDWVINDKYGVKIDVSYNNFTSSSSYSCPLSSFVNLVSTYSSSASASNSDSWCMKKGLGCSGTPKYYSLFINCGGESTTYGGNEYAADLTPGGPSYFVTSEKWAYSTTGVFTDREREDYNASNSFGLNITGADLYRTARLASTSLRYYGLCLRKGSYKVTLHFAEIMFSGDQTFSSLGRRYFDVLIQGNVVLKNFNIAKEAGGVGKAITRDFNITVNDSTLAIHLYWSGKGTTSLPHKAVYGPLLSAISVTPNFNPHSRGHSAEAIVGIIVATCVVVVLTVLLLRWKGYICAKDLEDKELRALNLQTGYFTLRQIKAATDNFDPAKKIGEGGFGPVYKGVLSNGSVIAVKQLSSKSKQGNREFVNEIGMISALQHPNLVRLYGCCIEGNQLLLIYEYMENNCLARALFGTTTTTGLGNKKKICLGIARGLAYLHEESRLKIVHRDIKATNVLLDRDLNAKISDFGLAKLDEEENTHISTRIAGTFGYMAPEYAMHGYLTYKADVYSFGIVTLEIVSGRCNASNRTKENSFYILDWAHALKEKGDLMELVDPRLGSEFDREEVMVMINVALLCTDVSLAVRPAMSSVVSILEGRMVPHELISEPTVSSTGIKPESIEENRNDRRVSSASVDGPWTASSASAGDLCLVKLDSAYLAKRE